MKTGFSAPFANSSGKKLDLTVKAWLCLNVTIVEPLTYPSRVCQLIKGLGEFKTALLC
jgi:hypothetical protein